MVGTLTAAPLAVSTLLGGCTGDDMISSRAASSTSAGSRSDAGRAASSDAGSTSTTSSSDTRAAYAAQEAKAACPSGQEMCAGACVFTSKDRDNCGACGNACGDGMVCSGGTCAVSCPASEIECGGSCVNPMTDNDHCGATLGCGEDDAGSADAGSDDASDGGSSAGQACDNGLVCSGGTCGATCQADLAICGGTCVDEQNDPNHCGSCDPCQPDGGGVAISDCRAGVCVAATCSAGKADCNGTYADGCEIDTQTDPQNCGFCGNVCDQRCVAGNCVDRSAITSDYAGFITASQTANIPNVIIPGDSISESNNYGGFYFKLASSVVRVRIAFTGASGSSSVEVEEEEPWDPEPPMTFTTPGGTGGSGTVDLAASFFTAQSQNGFWIVLGQGGLVSAGETSPLSSFRAFNGGGAATDWSGGQGTYQWAAGGGGGSDLRFTFDGSTNDPHGGGDPTASWTSRFAVLGGGGGATSNGAKGGSGGGFNSNGGSCPDFYAPKGTGGTTTAGGSIGGALGIGGDGLEDGTEGWAGGGGGGYYGGGAPSAHGCGGGGSGYLTSADGVTQVSTQDGTEGGGSATLTHGSFTLTAY